MSLPATLNTVPVRGQYTDFTGLPVIGSVTFTPSAPVVIAGADDVVVIARPRVVPLDEEGRFEVQLPATDDPDVNPTGFTYLVTETFSGVRGRTPYSIQVPLSAASAGIDISEVSPVAPVTGVVRTTRLSELDDVDLAGLTEGQGIGWNAAGLWEPRSFETTAGAQAKANAAHDDAVAEAAIDATTKADDARDTAITQTTTTAAGLAASAQSAAVGAAAVDAAARVLVEHDRAINAEQAEATARAAAVTTEATARATADALRLLKAGDSMTGALAMGGNKISGLADPTAAQDAATRAYVLAQITALINGAPGILDTLGEIATQLATDESAAAALATALATETTNRQNADALLIPLAQKAAASGVASLDASTRLTFAQKALRVVRAVTAATNVATGDDIVLAGGTTAYAVQVPSAVTFAGREFTIKRKSTGVITVTSAAGTIDDLASYPLNTLNQSITVFADGTNWQVI